MPEAQRFAFSYDMWGRPVMSPLGAGPKFSHVDIDRDAGALVVRQGVFFRAVVPLASITAAAPHTSRTISRGAHGWAGRWLVNGSARGLVRLTIDPPATGYVVGVRVTLRELILSLTAPDDFIAALALG